MGITHVIWDWNGTLFDDVGCSVGVANRLLEEFGLERLDGLAGYHATFRFPIVEYYADLGFDTSPTGNFEAAAHRYIQLYHEAAATCGLHAGASEVLGELHGRGVRQVVISASQQENLDRQMAPFALGRWLDGAHGLGDIYAASKEGIVQHWLRAEGVAASQVVMVGDSEHDFEIADAVGAHCVLYAGGHHARAHLAGLGVPVVDDLAAITALLDWEPAPPA